jgi:hypothetical protein
MKTTPGASNVTIGTSLTEGGAAHYAWVKQFISPPLTAQTISGTFALVNDFNEGNVLHNMNPHIFIYVWKADDSGSRGTLYAAASSTLEADTTNGSLQTFTFASYTLSSLAVSAGDRIVVELMAYDNNTKTSAYDHIIGLNGAAASGYESYIEFSMNLAWNVATYTLTKYGDGRIRKTAELSKFGDGRIKKTMEMSKFGAGRVLKGQQFTKLSDGAVITGPATYSITKYADGRVVKYQTILKTSDGKVKGTVEFTKTSMGKIAGEVAGQEGRSWWYR